MTTDEQTQEAASSRTSAYPDLHGVRRVAVLGAGVIGASWCAWFLARGFEVAVFDPDADARASVAGFVARAWPSLQALGLVLPDTDGSRLQVHDDVAGAVAGAQFVQECGPDRLPLKQALFDAVDAALAPGVVVATSTSSLLVSDLQAGRRHAQRYVAGHPFNPPHLVPLVEVVGGSLTDPAAVDWAMAFYRVNGRHPVRLGREAVGHIANRLTAALYQEAVHIVSEGIGSVQDVDDAVRYGPGLRYAIMGPHLTYHLAGGDAGIRHFLDHLAPGQERRFADLGRVHFDEAVKTRITEGVEAEAAGRDVESLAKARDEALVAIQNALVRLPGGGV